MWQRFFIFVHFENYLRLIRIRAFVLAYLANRQNSKNWMFGNLRFFGFKFSFLHVYRRNSESLREKNPRYLTFPRNLSF